MNDFPELREAVQLSLQKLGADDNEASVIAAVLARLVTRAAQANPEDAATSLERLAAELQEAVRAMRKQPNTRDIERIVQRSLAEDEA